MDGDGCDDVLYDTLTAPGDLTGDGRPDVVARDKAGVLWGYGGQGVGKFDKRVQIGGGWGVYTRLN